MNFSTYSGHLSSLEAGYFRANRSVQCRRANLIEVGGLGGAWILEVALLIPNGLGVQSS